MLMEKLPPWITAPLNSAMDCCLPPFWESEDGVQVSEEDEAGVPAITLLSTFDMCICCFVETVLHSNFQRVILTPKLELKF